MLHNVEKTFLAICGQSGYNIANCVNRPESRMEAPMTKWIKWIKSFRGTGLDDMIIAILAKVSVLRV